MKVSSGRPVFLRSILISMGVLGMTACDSANNNTSNSNFNPGAQDAIVNDTAPNADLYMSGTSADRAVAVNPGWATKDRFVRFMDKTESISVQVHLQMHNQSQAAAELAAISNPASPSYRKFLTNAEFAAKYGPTLDDVATVRAHFESYGLHVSYVADNRAFISLDGTAAQMGRAFSTNLGMYQVGADLKHAPAQPAYLPEAVNARILGVIGLATPRTMKPHAIRRDAMKGSDGSSKASASGCSTWFGQTPDLTDPAYGLGWPALTYAPCGYVPGQLRQAYGLDKYVASGFNGAGQTVAIVDAFTPPTLVKDVQQYFINHDASYPLNKAQITLLTGPGTPAKVDTGWYDESSLDVAAVHAMAPGANIVYVGAAGADDPSLIAAVNLIVSKNLASIISNSYDGLESDYLATAGSAEYAAWLNIAQQAGLMGIGLYFASGDAGDESTSNNGVAVVDFPASLPYVTAVGGTSLAIAKDGSRTWERAWETGISQLKRLTRTAPLAWTPAAPGSFYFGSGGGTSKAFAQPSWQVGIVPQTLASPGGGGAARVVPDVAMLADPYTGYLIGETTTSGRKSTYGEYAIGGTSLATPLFAATVALAQQELGIRFGFANPLWYKASKSGAFTDIVPGANQVVSTPSGVAATIDYHGAGNSIQSAIGYDATTGLGAVTSGDAFFKALKASLP